MRYRLSRNTIGWVSALYAIVISIPIIVGHDAFAAGLYVADASAPRVVRFGTKLTTGEAESLVLGQPDFTSFLANGTQDRMNEPSGVIFQSSSNTLWVADFANARVLGFIHGGAGFSNGQNADLVIGQPDFSNPNPICHHTRSGLCLPADVAFDGAGNLWVADESSSRVTEYKPPFTSGEDASVVIGQPNFTSDACNTTQDGMCGPTSLSFDPSGNLWVLDSANNRNLEYKPPFTNGESASVVLGKPDFTSSTCETTQSGICPDSGFGQVRSDKHGNIWESDTGNDRVLEFPRGSGFTTGENASVVIGEPNFTSKTSTFPPTRNGLNGPWGLTFDRKGNLYVSDFASCRVLKFKPRNGKFKNNQNAALVLGQPNFTTSTCAVSQTNLQNPRGIGFGP